METEVVFRFHTGSIKRSTFNALMYPTNEFRFHTGSIKSLPFRTISDGKDLSFDSILVRLKDKIAMWV